MPETLFLTVNLIDRFLNEKQVTRKNLQLVGASALSHTHTTAHACLVSPMVSKSKHALVAAVLA